MGHTVQSIGTSIARESEWVDKEDSQEHNHHEILGSTIGFKDAGKSALGGYEAIAMANYPILSTGGNNPNMKATVSI